MSTNVNQIYAFSIVDQLIKFGVNQFYISPGLRNAPLISAITNFSGIKIFTEIDERSAGYRALGAAKSNHQPVALVCTSGTALLNYAPAIAEANKTNTPLIVISADRPNEMINMNTNQTLNQNNIFLNLGTDTYSFETPSNENPLYESIRNLSFYLHKKININKVTAHINIPFRGHLDQRAEKINSAVQNDYDLLKNYSRPLFHSQNEFIKMDLVRPLLLIGDGIKINEKENLINLLNRVLIPNICDITSGLKLLLSSKNYSLPSIDHPETENFLKIYNPTAVIQIGERFISKKYDIYLRNKNINWYYYSNTNENIPNSCPTVQLNCSFSEFCSQLEKGISPQNIDLTFINEVNSRKRDLIDSSNNINLPFFSKLFLDNSKSQDCLFIGNSSVIRSFDFYINENQNEKYLNVFTNRGVSGIEGNISTAIGIYETINPNNISLILGDISFLHDLNSLKELYGKNHRFKIFVLNDQKGGIFDLLPLELNMEAKEIISSPHPFNFKKVSEQFNINYQFIDSKDNLQHAIIEEINAPKIYEIKIDPKENFEIYQKLKTIK